MSWSSNQPSVKSLKSLCIRVLARSVVLQPLGRMSRAGCRPSEARRGGRHDVRESRADERCGCRSSSVATRYFC